MSEPDLGKCCVCCTDKNVRNLITLHYKAPLAGRGWGCMVCQLPSDGAVAVVCDRCVSKLQGYKAGPIAGLLYACRGYPATDGRIPIAELLKLPAHEHKMELHTEEEK